MLEKHISPTQMSDFSRAFRADLTCECASRLLRGTSSIIGVSHRVSDARKRSFVRSLISYCPLEGSVAHSCRYEAQLKGEKGSFELKLVFLRSSPGTVLTLAWTFILQLWLNETQFCPATLMVMLKFLMSVLINADSCIKHSVQLSN